MRRDDRWKMIRNMIWKRLSTVALPVLAVALLPMGAGGQERPDFSGIWTRQGGGMAAGGARGAAGSLGSGWGSSFTMEQDADTLTVTRVFFARNDLQPPIRYRFALDGSEARTVVLMGLGMQEQLSTTRWDGDKLVIITVYDVPEGQSGGRITSEVTHTLSLQPPRAGRAAWPPSLVVETVRGGVLGGPSSTTRTVYTKN